MIGYSSSFPLFKTKLFLINRSIIHSVREIEKFSSTISRNQQQIEQIPIDKNISTKSLSYSNRNLINNDSLNYRLKIKNYVFPSSTNLFQFNYLLNSSTTILNNNPPRQRLFASNSSSSYSSKTKTDVNSIQLKQKNLRSSIEFHDRDNLDIQHWRLIYSNNSHHGYEEYIAAGAAILLVGTMISIVIIIYLLPEKIYFHVKNVDEKQQKKPTGTDFRYQRILTTVLLISTVFLIVSIMITRWRRIRVLRLYERPPNYEPPPPLKNTIYGRTMKAKLFKSNYLNYHSDYCIIWMTSFLLRKRYFYMSTQTSHDADEKKSPVLARFFGNFRARNRSWHVFRECFDDDKDYQRVRRRDVKI